MGKSFPTPSKSFSCTGKELASSGFGSCFAGDHGKGRQLEEVDRILLGQSQENTRRETVGPRYDRGWSLTVTDRDAILPLDCEELGQL